MIRIELIASAAATDVAIQKRIVETGEAALPVSNGEMEDIMKIVKSLKVGQMMKNGFDFILKVIFVFKIFKFLSWLFAHIEETLW